jgi:ankyrin repeat protein
MKLIRLFCFLLLLIVLAGGCTKSEPESPEELVTPEQKRLNNALHSSVKAGDVDRAQSLISEGANINAMDNAHATPLSWAAMLGQKEVAELLISAGADLNPQDAFSSISPLHHAATNGKRDLAELLINSGADVNAKLTGGLASTLGSLRGATPLHGAAQNARPEIVELLIDSGVDLNAKDSQGRTPLQYATEMGYGELVELLRTHGAKE